MNRLIGVLNPQQWKLLTAVAFGATGPFAWFLSRKLGLSGEEVKMWLDFAATITPLIGGVFVAAASTNAAQVQSVAAMPAQDKAAEVGKLSDKDQAGIAAALPDKAVVIAAGSVPGVQVHAEPGVAPQSVIAAALDPKLPDVVVMSGGPVLPDGKLG